VSTFHSSRTSDPRTATGQVYDVQRTSWVPIQDEEALIEYGLNDIQHSLSGLVGQADALLGRPTKWTTQIRDLGEEGYVLAEPIHIVIEEYPDESVIARFPEVEAFGEGQSEPEAIQDLKSAILDLYDELMETDSDVLGDTPKMWLRVLERIITRG
jgi:hypothetical protein